MTVAKSANGCVIKINNLTVAYQQEGEWLEAVREVSLCIHRGESYGLVGESGSGKTTLALAVMNYLGESGSIRAGNIHLGDVDLLSLNDTQLRQVWGSKVTLVPQNPQSSLNPSIRVGEQLNELLRFQLALPQQEAQSKAIEWLEKVRLGDPVRVADSYPHQISGGMQQRVMIAMALCTAPDLLILDEPTTNLDVTTQAVILDLIGELIQDQDVGVLYVTHNLGVIAQICDRVAVMYASELVEDAATQELFSKPLHPYTQGLIDSIPHLGDTKESIQLRAVQGQIPPIGKGPSGCVFRTRCPTADEICESRPPLYKARDSRYSRCHRWEEIDHQKVNIHQPLPAAQPSYKETAQGKPLTLDVNNLNIHFPLHRSLPDIIRRQPAKLIQAVNNVDFDIPAGSTVGLVGESGSGKTTIARGIMGLERKIDGSIELIQIPLPAELSQRDLDTLRLLQIVFQNPQEALNPYITIGESLSRPLIRLLGLSKTEAISKVRELLESVRLPVSYIGRMPGQLSGGEVQRVALARAFASNPELLVLDEPISSLDVSVQAAILNLVGELQSEHQNSLLFISHDLTIVSYLADRIAVIYLGSLMELTASVDLFQPPYHPYTEALLASIPQVYQTSRKRPVYLEGEIPTPTDLPSGCPFHTRCPRFLGEICTTTIPPWQVDRTTGKNIYCHISPEELAESQERLITRRKSNH